MTPRLDSSSPTATQYIRRVMGPCGPWLLISTIAIGVILLACAILVDRVPSLKCKPMPFVYAAMGAFSFGIILSLFLPGKDNHHRKKGENLMKEAKLVASQRPLLPRHEDINRAQETLLQDLDDHLREQELVHLALKTSE